ncbi:F0F1 ATP synthase subunit A [Patescibacteria group bacterium]|nr:F0F1 ATP synthase subunit A [Patescibacteria group bacterium]
MDNIHISLHAEQLGQIFGMPITNSLVLSLVTSFLLIGGGFLVIASLRLVPAKIQNGGEIIIEGLLDFMTQVLGDKKLALKFFPLVATFFLFILVSNWVGVMPGIGSLGFTEVQHGKEVFVPFFRSAAADLNTTFALALIAMVAIHIYGIAKLGFFSHWGKFFVFTKGPIYFFVGLLELIGEFAKILSFSFRLFGNIFAGEVLLVIVAALLPAFLAFGLLPFLFLEFFVGFIQALVFAMLTLVFLKVATTEVEH